MSIPNLINVINNKEIEESVFSDFEINRILSYSDMQILKWPCDEKEICSRQGIFRSMENKNFFSLLTRCNNAIADYDNAKKFVRKAHNEIETHCGRIRLLEEYIAICDCFRNMTGYCEAAEKVAAYFLSKEKTEELNAIKNNVAEMKEILLRVSECSISFQNEFNVEKGHTSPSYIDMIHSCAAALRLDISRHSPKNIPFDSVLSDAVLVLHGDLFLRLNTIEKKYEEQLEYDFSEIKSQIQFILNIWSLVQKAASLGITYTFPVISKVKEIRINNAYSISLLAKGTKRFVPNNIFFNEDTPFYFVTGANGGGKTEYLRALGTNLILFLSGCPIFAENALIYPFTYLSSHFPKDERFERTGRLDDEANRVASMMKNADSESVLLFNETFSGTDQKKGLSMLLHLAEDLNSNRIFSIAVTHLHGVEKEKYAILCPEVVQSQDSNMRTYRIVRRKSESGSYARDIIRKYNLDYESLQKRKASIND